MAEAQRIQKMLAHAGIGSRRQVEGWIRAGRLRVNGRAAVLGQHISPGDQVALDGRTINLERRLEVPSRVLLYRKPAGQVVTRRDPQGRDSVFAHLPRLKGGRWIAVGRLDINTSGLLVLTTDGELARRMMHPSYGLEREYAVRVLGALDNEALKRLTQGVELEDGPAHFDVIQRGGGRGANQWFHVIVREGRKRLVRRLFESQDVTVSRLIRTRFGPLGIPTGTRVGRGRELDRKEVAQLMRAVGLKSE